MSTYQDQQRNHIDSPLQASRLRSISRASTRNSVLASSSTQPYNQEMPPNFVQQMPQRPGSNSGAIPSSRISVGSQHPHRSSRRRRPDGRQSVSGATNAQRSQQRAAGHVPRFEPTRDMESRLAEREQGRLVRRLENNNDPETNQVVSAISIIHGRANTWSKDACLAMFCRTLRHSLVHPRKLRLLGIIPQDLPPMHVGRFPYPSGMANPRAFVELVIEHLLLNITARLERFLVLPDDAPYHEVDIYFGRPFLDQYFSGNLPNTWFPISHGDRVMDHRQAVSSRGSQVVPTTAGNFIPITASSASSQYFPREFSTPITLSSRTSNAISSEGSTHERNISRRVGGEFQLLNKKNSLQFKDCRSSTPHFEVLRLKPKSTQPLEQAHSARISIMTANQISGTDVGSIAPLIGSPNQWQAYQNSQGDPHVATVSATGVSALPAYSPGPMVTYTPQEQSVMYQYNYPCPPEAASNNNPDPGNYLRVPESSNMGPYLDITSGSASPAPHSSISWPYSPEAQFE